jgi:hypothetical protein
MATAVRAFSSAPAAPGAGGGVSMVQGASRGIGLEFVSTQTQTQTQSLLSAFRLRVALLGISDSLIDPVSRLSISARR